MENFADKFKSLSNRDLDECVSKLFYFTPKEKASTTNDSTISDKWIQIPNTSYLAYNLAEFGDLDFDKDSRYTQTSIDGSKLNSCMLMYSKLFYFNNFYNILNKRYSLYTREADIYREFCTSSVSSIFRLPPKLIGNVLYCMAFPSVMDLEFESLISGEYDDETLYTYIFNFISVKYIRYFIMDAFINFYNKIKDDLDSYTEDNLITAFGYILTNTLYTYTTKCMKLYNILAKSDLLSNFNIKVISDFDISSNNNEYIINNFLQEKRTFSFDKYYMSAIINNISKYINKLKDIDTSTIFDFSDPRNEDFIMNQRFFDIEDIKFFSYILFQSSGKLPDESERKVCNDLNEYFQIVINKQQDLIKAMDHQTKGTTVIEESPLLSTMVYNSIYHEGTIKSLYPNLYDKFIKLPSTIDSNSGAVISNIIKTPDDMKALDTLKLSIETETIPIFLYFLGVNITR